MNPPVKDENNLCLRILPSSFEIAYNILGTPWPTLSRIINRKKITVNTIPTMEKQGKDIHAEKKHRILKDYLRFRKLFF